MYATLLLWLLSELFENLPEAGDLDKPKLVFFFDEAHLLFADAPDALVEKIEQVVRLIRSKGVGVYFVTQNPADVPDKVLSQLGNRVQHALRAFSPRDQKAVKAAAQTMRDNPELDEQSAITELGVGEALVSFLDEKGRPGIVERAFIVPPAGQIGPITPEQRRQLIDSSLVACTKEAWTASRPTKSSRRAPSTWRRNPPNRPPWPRKAGKRPAACSAAPAAAREWSRPWSKAPRARSAASWAARSCAACWAASWAASVSPCRKA
jgi:hypothetical protein